MPSASSSPTPPPTLHERADAWAARHWWGPRLVPLLVWLLFLMLIRITGQWSPMWLPMVYGAQVLVTALLLLRWRRLLPEITLRFHWLALPAAAVVFAAWLGLGWLCRGTWSESFQAASSGAPMPSAAGTPLTQLLADHPGLGWLTLGLRLLGMTLVVPCIEEVFFRSAIPRAIPSWPALGRRILQLLADWPVLGQGASRMLQTPAWNPPPTPRPWPWSWAGAVTSTALFMLNHQRVDWAGAAVAGFLWCALAAWAKRGPNPKGLGPVIWSHALANAGLWAWCVARGDFAFL